MQMNAAMGLKVVPVQGMKETQSRGADGVGTPHRTADDGRIRPRAGTLAVPADTVESMGSPQWVRFGFGRHGLGKLNSH
jgi:hypothetical protein